MIQESDEKTIRNHLLGNLPEEELSRAEQRLLADDDYFEMLTVIEEELIDDYVSGDLTDEDRKQFEAHFLSTPARRAKLGFAQTLNEYASRQTPYEEPNKNNVIDPPIVPHPLWWKRSFSSPSLRLAAAAVIVIGIGVVIWLIISSRTGPSQGIVSLNKAYSEQRPVESRITEFGYAPPPPVTRGTEQGKFDYLTRDRAQALIQLEAGENPNAQSYHDLGRLYLTQHEFDKAIDQFEKALTLDGNNARIHSDLGAAYLERASVGKLNLSDLDKSLEQLNRAIELDNSQLPAYFNRGLCLQRMNALVQAKQAWEDYLKRDANSKWSEEAERNLTLLRNQGASNKTADEVFQDFVAAYRRKDEAQAWRIQSQTKEMITGTMIPFQLAERLTNANLSDQIEVSNEILELLKFAGGLEKQYNGDPFFAEMAEFYAVSAKNNGESLKQAQEALRLGYQLCLKGLYSDARRPFENAQRLFLQSGNVWESKVINYWQAYCLFYAGELRESSDLLQTLAADCQHRHYHWLELQSRSWLANNNILQGDYSRGIDHERKALNLAIATDDLYSRQKISSQIAEDYKFLNRLEEALELSQQSLPRADDYFVSPRQFWRTLFSITDTLFALRLYAAAEIYEKEALQLALNHFNDPALTHSTYQRLGQLYMEQENYQAATEALELSIRTLQPLERDPISKKLFGLSMLQIGNLKRRTEDYAAALQYYQQAAQKFDSSGFGLYDYITRKEILLCHLLNKDDHIIQQELPALLNLFESNRHKIKEELSRNHFFDAEQDVYELAINYEYERNDIEKSFHYAELSRARALQDAIIGGAASNNDLTTPDIIVPAVSQSLTPDKLQKRLTANLQLVEYAVLRDRLLIWVITRAKFKVIEQSVSSATLKAATDDYLQALMRSDADSIRQERVLAGKLYDWLFAPLEDHLDKNDEVAIVPDKFLFKVPFAALLSRQSNQRVVNDYTLLYAPSATVLVLCSDQARTKSQDKETERLLSIGNPVVSEQQPDLPSAAFEARQIASFYRVGKPLTEQGALKEKVELELRQANVIHFASHYVVDDLFPAKSRLLLTSKHRERTDEPLDDLSLQEIQTMRLPRGKVAILSACKSGIERYFAGEGLIGLSRAFLIAGIPLVIASQWSVESTSATDLMIDLHRLRKTKNITTTRALRQAQLNMLNCEDGRYSRPYYWAAFFPIGGHALY